mgnify:CR=1 FL=1
MHKFLNSLILLLSLRRVRREQFILYFPLVYKLAYAETIGFVANGCATLRPFYQTFKRNFVSSLDDDISNCTVFNGATNCARRHAEKAGRFGHGYADGFHRGSMKYWV